MEKKPKATYSFAAMNTAEGFRGYFREIFGDADQLYIIKGGPGTGKSRFMKELGARAEECGRTVEYFLCSSDPTSVDGVIFTDGDGKRTGVIDGTSPHAYEPTLAGVREHILNFGDFWNTELLRPRMDELEALSAAKKRLYSSLYSHLSAIRSLDETVKTVSHGALDEEKMRSAARRLIKSIRGGKEYRESVRIRSAVSCDGEITLDGCFNASDKRYAIMDCFFTAERFMLALKNELTAVGAEVQISYSPFSPMVPDAIRIPSADTSFYIGCNGAEGEKTVNMRRFTLSERLSPYRPRLRETLRLRRDALRLMNSDAASIRSLHGAIEAIYGEAMDFTKKEALTRELCQRLFG